MKYPKLSKYVPSGKYCEDTDELINEHERIVKLLKHIPSNADHNKLEQDEANIQSKELEKYKKYKKAHE